MDLHYLAESENDEAAINAGSLPWGYTEVGPLELSDRDPSLVETDYEIELWHHEQMEAGIRQPFFTCGYCSDSYRSSSLDNALRWWHAHDCLTLEQRERLAMLHDLGASLPAGHPFAPVVDGKLAA